MIALNDVGAHAREDTAGQWSVRFGLYLPGITFNKGYRLKLRIIHEADQFTRDIEPRDFWMSWNNGSALDLWTTDVPFVPGASGASGHFGHEGGYLYRYQLQRDGRDVAFWFSDPFARASGLGTLSAFTLDSHAQPFQWTDAGYTTPEVDELVVYEVNVREFNIDFDGLTAQLDYIHGLGVNVLELMPVSNVKETAEWGYTPLDFYAPDERLGGAKGLKRLVNAAHARGMAVILDSVYAHTHPEFTYHLVYAASGEPNPILGRFEGEFFDWPGVDYLKPFAREYFLALNKYLLDEYHVDGFRYDYVPGMYDGPMGQGYADLVFRTYRHSQTMTRFQAPHGRSRIIQCAEHLPDAAGILRATHSNCAWQNGMLDRTREMAHGGLVTERLAHQLDPEFLGYPSQHTAAGDTFPVAPFQYLESHDHARFINQFGGVTIRDLLGERFGNRNRYFKVQPYVIGLYTAKGIPMLWCGQEFAESWGMPGGGLGRNLFERPLHWEFFYDEAGKALVRLHRVLGTLRRTHRALRSRGFFYYFHDSAHLAQGVLAYRRKADADGGAPAEDLVVVLNFSDSESAPWIPFPSAGIWREQIDGTQPAVNVATAGQWLPVTVPSNYGAVYKLT